MLRFLTAGESHGLGLTTIIDGLPAGIPLSTEYLDRELNRRRKGYGRGDRMKIESDKGRFTSGVRHGFTLGSPVTVYIENKDSGNWGKIMSCELEDQTDERKVLKPRPGHCDLPGMLKYGHKDCRNILERSSARETAARVAGGAICKALLKEFGIQVHSYVVSIGSQGLSPEQESVADLSISKDPQLSEAIERSEVSCFDPAVEAAMISEIETAKAKGDTLGGIIKLVVTGLPIGLGSHTQWDRRLDSALAAALMSIQAVKGVEIGAGFGAAALPGSLVHDPIVKKDGRIGHSSNHAGGIEGGVSNGEDLILRFAMKPIPTLYAPLDTIDMKTGEVAKADVERSDVCAVPAAAVVGEAMTAFTIASFLIEKLGGDSVSEMKRNLAGIENARTDLLPKL